MLTVDGIFLSHDRKKNPRHNIVVQWFKSTLEPVVDLEKYLWGGKRGAEHFEGWQHLAASQAAQIDTTE